MGGLQPPQDKAVTSRILRIAAPRTRQPWKVPRKPASCWRSRTWKKRLGFDRRQETEWAFWRV